jgi:hypothetical protein
MLCAHGWFSGLPCCGGLVSTQYGEIRRTILHDFSAFATNHKIRWNQEISLISGQILTAIPYDGARAETTIKGQWEFGEYSLSLFNAKQVRFQQTQSTSGTPEWNPPLGFVAKVNDTVLHDLGYVFEYQACQTYWISCKPYIEISTIRTLLVLRNSALYFIPFSKISQVSPSEVLLTDNAKIQIQLYLKSNDADVFEGDKRWIIGETKTGRVHFPIKDVQSITFIAEQYSPVKENREHEVWKVALESTFRGTVVTDSDASIDLNRFVFLTSTHANPYSYKAATKVEVSVGDASTTVDLSKLSTVKEFNIKFRDRVSRLIQSTSAKFVSKGGTLLPVTFNQPIVCVAGMMDFFYVKVCPPTLKVIDLK